jgi:prevent-host-death family protein
MITNLRESKAHLSALVDRAARGEEVVITVRGKPKARLCPIVTSGPLDKDAANRWGRQLKEARAKYSVGSHDSSSDIIDELRGERS